MIMIIVEVVQKAKAYKLQNKTLHVSRSCDDRLSVTLVG